MMYAGLFTIVGLTSGNVSFTGKLCCLIRSKSFDDYCLWRIKDIIITYLKNNVNLSDATYQVYMDTFISVKKLPKDGAVLSFIKYGILNSVEIIAEHFPYEEGLDSFRMTYEHSGETDNNRIPFIDSKLIRV